MCVLLAAVYRVMDTKDKLSILKEVDIHSSSSGKVKDIIYGDGMGRSISRGMYVKIKTNAETYVWCCIEQS